LSNSRGDRTTPAVVSVSEDEHNVGVTAKQRIGRPNVSILCGMKALLQFYDFDSTVGSWPHSRVFARAQVDASKESVIFNVNDGGDDGGKKITLHQALKELFGELMRELRFR
jgi:molecular chaperone DnaK (HSP70)